MKHVISLKPISAMYVSPQRQKRIRVEKFSALPFHSLKLCSSPPQNYDSLIDEDNMLIPVFDNLRRGSSATTCRDSSRLKKQSLILALRTFCSRSMYRKSLIKRYVLRWRWKEKVLMLFRNSTKMS